MCKATPEMIRHATGVFIALLVLCSMVGSALYHGALILVERLATVIARRIKARRLPIPK